MKKKAKPILVAAIMIILLLGLTGAAVGVDKDTTTADKVETAWQQFTDVDSKSNNAIYINYLAGHDDIIKGYPDGTYHPQEALTRAQAAVILVKAAGLDLAAADSPFSDVTTGHWAAGSIAAAAEAGYLKGYPDGSYHPDETLTRAQGISLIMRLSSQKEREALPQLKDIQADHWAAADMATALKAGMIGLSTDGSQIYPEKPLTRGSLARALATLLTKDPGLYKEPLTGTIKEAQGEIKITRAGITRTAQNGSPVYKGDNITTGKGSKASISYPDGSSVLIKENSEIYIKESTGRSYIKNQGQRGTAVENVDIELKQGTLFGALATKQEKEEQQQARTGETLLASLDSLRYIAENQQAAPWYQEAQAKKVKMKVDMPWGVAAIRGTFILVSVNQDGSCSVSCLTGDAQVEGNNGEIVALGERQSSGIAEGGTPEQAAPMSEEAKQEFSTVQQWVVNTALQIDQNKEAQAPPLVEMIVEVPDAQLPPVQQAEQIQNTIQVVLNALQASGIQLTPEVKANLQEQLQQKMPEISQQVEETLEQTTPTTNQTNNQTSNGSSGGTESSSSVSHINYSTAGTYGPATAESRQAISKNVIVSATGVTLQNMIISKDLTLAAGIGDGSVTLKNVKVQGNTNILGGGPNSITLEDSELYTVTVNNQTNTVRIVAQGNTMVGALTLNSGARLEETGLSGGGFSTITTGPNIPSGATIILSGSFAAVNINSPGLNFQVESGSIQQLNISSAAGGTNLTLASGVYVDTLQIEAQAEISGAGQILNAIINAEGVELQQAPLNWSTTTGVTVTIGGESRTGSSVGNARLYSLSLSPGILSPGFSPGTFTYTASVGNSVYEVTVCALPQESTATVEVNGVSKADNTHVLNMEVGTNTIEILVNSPDGTASQEYDLTVTRAGSSTKTITAFKFNGLSPAVIGSITEANQTISLTVPYGTNVTALVPTITHTGASVSPASGAVQNFTSPVTYTLTAEDGSTQAYAVTVTVADSTLITSIGVITGIAEIGSELTAGAITPTGATVSYQWQRYIDGVWVDIDGAAAAVYTVASPVTIGDQIRVIATGTGNYAGTVTSDTVTVGFAGGAGTQADPYQIATAGQLNNVRYHLDSYYELTNNIDLEAYGENYDSGADWEPIGNTAENFTGTLDGKDYTISNLYINRSGQDFECIGLFGCINGGRICNLILIDVDVTGNSAANAYTVCVGALVGGNATSVSIENVYATGIVSCAGNNSYAGGLVGYNDEGDSIVSSYFTGSVSCDGVSCFPGGLVGANYGSIGNSHATGSMNCRGDGSCTGGLVGYNDEGDSIVSSYFAGSVSCDGVSCFPGGLVGANYGSIENSYATGSVSNEGGESSVGSLVGKNFEGSSIFNSYATGSLTSEGAGNYTGGLVGVNEGYNIVSSYYDQDTTGQSDTGNGEGKTSTAMTQQSTFIGWDFESIWTIDEGMTYPYLRQNQQEPKPEPTDPVITDISLEVNAGLQIGNVNTAAGAEIGTLSATGGTAAFAYELVADPGTPANSADNASFAISADTLTVGAGGALTVGKDYKITVKVTDSKGMTCTKGFTITVASAPTPLTAVTIIGTAVVDNQLSANLTPVDATATYQWQRCDTVDGTYEDIPGAISGTYTPVQADAGKFIRVVATGTGSYGGSVISAATADVAIVISYIEDLYAINNDLSGSYILMQDLDFTQPTSYSSSSVNTEWVSGGTGWTPIGTFTGMFDGNGHTISNLYIVGNSSSLGLFSCLAGQGTIKNLGLVNISITGTNIGGSDTGAGAFAGKLDNNGYVLNSYSTGTIACPDCGVAGGIVGYSYSGVIIGCSSSVNVSGGGTLGGISGRNFHYGSYPLIQDCYSTGNITGTGSTIGGITGNAQSGTITRCYATGSVSGTANVGGLAGCQAGEGILSNSFALNSAVTISSGTETTVGSVAGYNNSGTVSGCYANSSISITPSSHSGVDGTGKTLTEAREKQTYLDNGWSGYIDDAGSSTTTAWVIDDGHYLPTLRGQNYVTPPKMTSAIRDSDTQIIVALSELVCHDSITKSSDGGFTVEKTGDSGTTFTVSGIAAGTVDNQVVLTVADMSGAALTGVTVKYTSGGNGTVADLTGSLMNTDSSGIEIGPWYVLGLNDVYIARDDNSNTLVLMNAGSNLQYTTEAVDTVGSSATWTDGTGSEITITSSGKYVVVREKDNTANNRCLGYINSALGNQLLRTGTITIDADCTNLFAYNGITDQIEISKLSGSTDLDESKAKVYVANALSDDFSSSGAVNPAGNNISASDLGNTDMARVSISGMSIKLVP